MNLILKIVQGPNIGAELALVEGVNVKLGSGDECDVVLADQTLPDVACEIEVRSERVALLLPGGGQERLDPLRVKVFGTTAIAVGPADSPWGPLVWPDPNAPEEPEEPTEEEGEQPEEKPRWRALQWTLLIVLVMVVVLEFVVWLFWPFFNARITATREWWLAKYRKWTADKLAEAAIPVHRQDLNDLAKAYNVTAVVPNGHSSARPRIFGNLKRRAERLRLTAAAYSISPGVQLDLSDDQTLRTAAEELLEMVAGAGELKVVSAEDRCLRLAGRVADLPSLRHVLESLKADVPGLEKVECDQVAIGEQGGMAVAEVTPAAETTAEGAKAPETVLPPVADGAVPVVAKTKDQDSALPKLPVVGVLTTPYPCLVLQNGARVVEGAEFNGFVIASIGEDTVLLKKGTRTFEWRP
ncbi:MAG: hypothetical protein IJJ33_16730 [Victivallales bacterium]|nr:hypothetical protein [Victivallales bacterium]